MLKRFFAWAERYERHLSAAAMVAGFVIDNIFFGRVDIPMTQWVFITYLVVTFISIISLHFLEARPERAEKHSRLRTIFPVLIQFMLGGSWSGFLVFYSRSATVGASWLFLLFLGCIFLGNEIFKKYHERLTFTSILFFFALFSYAIFTVPIVTHQIGDQMFLISGAIAVAAFSIFLMLVYVLGRERFGMSITRILYGTGAVYLLINLFYFTNILPPLPLASKALDIYHSVVHTPAGYVVVSEAEPWYTTYGFAPTLHVVPGEPLYAFSSTFAPTALTTNIVHRWEHYDTTTKKWVLIELVAYPISGGRDGGYRGYSYYRNPEVGKWRVSVETITGGIIGRLNFVVERVDTEPSLTTTTIP